MFGPGKAGGAIVLYGSTCVPANDPSVIDENLNPTEKPVRDKNRVYKLNCEDSLTTSDELKSLGL